MKKSTLLDLFRQHPRIGSNLTDLAARYLEVDVGPGLVCGIDPQTRRNSDRVIFTVYAGFQLDKIVPDLPKRKRPFELVGLIETLAQILDDPHPIIAEHGYSVPFWHALPAAEACRDIAVDICLNFADLLCDRERVKASIASKIHLWKKLDAFEDYVIEMTRG